MSEAPHWLLSAWVRTCVEAGTTASTDEIERYGLALLERWQEPARRYHTLKHLVEVLRRVDELVEETQAPALVRLAAWYHGIVFHPTQAFAGCRPGEDEVASAGIADHELTAMGLPDAKVARVHQLIVALERHFPDPEDFDCAALCDADLAILAAEPQKYKKYLAALREEFGHLPLADYLATRDRIITKLLSRRRLFTSPNGKAWEGPARQNLQVEQLKVRRELDRLREECGCEPGDPHIHVPMPLADDRSPNDGPPLGQPAGG